MDTTETTVKIRKEKPELSALYNNIMQGVYDLSEPISTTIPAEEIDDPSVVFGSIISSFHTGSFTATEAHLNKDGLTIAKAIEEAGLDDPMLMPVREAMIEAAKEHVSKNTINDRYTVPDAEKARDDYNKLAAEKVGQLILSQ